MKKLLLLLLFIPLVSFGQKELEELTISDWNLFSSGDSEEYLAKNGESYVTNSYHYEEKGGRFKSVYITKWHKKNGFWNDRSKSNFGEQRWRTVIRKKLSYSQPFYGVKNNNALEKREEDFDDGKISKESNFKGSFDIMKPIYDGFSRIYNEGEICFEEFYIYHNRVYRFNSICSPKTINTVSARDAKIVDEYDLEAMVNVFLDDYCNNLFEDGFWGESVEITRYLERFKNMFNIKATFVPLEGDALALSYGFNDIKNIIIKVDPEKWAKASSAKRWYTLYHELGHDVFDFEHGQGGKMMFNFADRDYNWETFEKDRNYMFKKAIEKEKKNLLVN